MSTVGVGVGTKRERNNEEDGKPVQHPLTKTVVPAEPTPKKIRLSASVAIGTSPPLSLQEAPMETEAADSSQEANYAVTSTTREASTQAGSPRVLIPNDAAVVAAPTAAAKDNGNEIFPPRREPGRRAPPRVTPEEPSAKSSSRLIRRPPPMSAGSSIPAPSKRVAKRRPPSPTRKPRPMRHKTPSKIPPPPATTGGAATATTTTTTAAPASKRPGAHRRQPESSRPSQRRSLSRSRRPPSQQQPRRKPSPARPRGWWLRWLWGLVLISLVGLVGITAWAPEKVPVPVRSAVHRVWGQGQTAVVHCWGQGQTTAVAVAERSAGALVVLRDKVQHWKDHEAVELWLRMKDWYIHQFVPARDRLHQWVSEQYVILRELLREEMAARMDPMAGLITVEPHPSPIILPPKMSLPDEQHENGETKKQKDSSNSTASTIRLSEKHTLRSFLMDEAGFGLGIAPAFFGFFGYFGALAAWDELLVAAKTANVGKSANETAVSGNGDHFLQSSGRLRSISGASAGAMAAVLIASGIPPREAATYCSNITLGQFADFPGVGGIFRGNLFEQLMVDFVAQSPLALTNSEGGNLRMEDGALPVAVTAFDLQSWKGHILTRGSMARAARASATFPLLFQPVYWKGETADDPDHLFVDGGIEDSFGVQGLAALREKSATKTPPQPYRVVNLGLGAMPDAPGPSAIPGSAEVLSISLQNLPNCGPHAMSQGPIAVQAAYEAMSEALDQPLHVNWPQGNHFHLNIDTSKFWKSS